MVRTTRVALAVTVLVCAPACTSSGVTTKSTPPAPLPTQAARTATAEDVVVAYYQRLGRHDIRGAAQLLTPSLSRQYLAAGPDGDFRNIVRISNIRGVEVTSAAPAAGLPAGHRDITQVFLTYDAVYRHVVAADNGPNSRFVYVGRSASGQWRILEIGTGP